MKETPHSSNLPSIVQYHLGPERPVFDHVSQQLEEYKIYTFDGHLSQTINNKVHEYNHVHEYEKVREYEYKEYNAVKEYEYKEYKANFITKAQYKALNAQKTSKKRAVSLPPIQKETVAPKRKSSTHKDPITQVQEYEYKEYEFKPYNVSNVQIPLESKVDSYIDRRLEEYKGPNTYKLNELNFPHFKHDYEDDTDYLKKYKSLRPVIFPKWGKFE